MAPQVGLEPTTLRLTVARKPFLLMTAVVCRLRQSAIYTPLAGTGESCQLLPFSARGPRYFPRYHFCWIRSQVCSRAPSQQEPVCALFRPKFGRLPRYGDPGGLVVQLGSLPKASTAFRLFDLEKIWGKSVQDQWFSRQSAESLPDCSVGESSDREQRNGFPEDREGAPRGDTNEPN